MTSFPLENDPDVTGLTPSGKRGGLEYAHPGSRNIGRLRDQRNKHLKYCDVWMCVCQSSNESTVAAAVGENYYRTRGSEFQKWLDSTRINEPEVNIKEEIRKANKEDEDKSNENSSSPLDMNKTGTILNLEGGEVLDADGTILQEVA